MATPESVTRDMSPLRQALHRLEDRRAVVLAPDREPCPARPGFRTQARRAPPDPTLAPSAGPEAVSGRFWPFAGESGPVGSFVSATGDPTRPAVPPDSDLIRRIRAARHLWKRARRHLWRPGDPWPAALAVGGTSAPPCNGYDPGVVTAGGFRISLPPCGISGCGAVQARARRPRPNRPAGPTGGQSEEFHRRLEKPCASLSARLGRPHARAPYRLATIFAKAAPRPARSCAHKTWPGCFVGNRRSPSSKGYNPLINWQTLNLENGHRQLAYALRDPVARHPSARPGPLRLLARISEYLTVTAGADPGFNGVLSANPTAPPDGRIVQ